MAPYLTGEIRPLFDAWHERLRSRHEAGLSFSEIRKGVQALSSLYVSRRGRLAEGARSLEGEGKRAAFCLFYAPLHFIAAWHVVREIDLDVLPFSRLWDLGCGIGPAGAAWGAAARLASAGRDAARPRDAAAARGVSAEEPAGTDVSTADPLGASPPVVPAAPGPHSPEGPAEGRALSLGPVRETSAAGSETAQRRDAAAGKEVPTEEPAAATPRDAAGQDRQRSRDAGWGRSIKVIGVDRSGFALEEAVLTYRAFGLRAEARRMDLGEAGAGAQGVVAIKGASGRKAPRRRSSEGLRPADAVVTAWALDELSEEGREHVLHRILAGRGEGRPVLILEPIARGVAPWWRRWESALGAEALLVHSFDWRRRLELPDWIAEMDRAAGLDHAELTARILAATV